MSGALLASYIDTTPTAPPILPTMDAAWSQSLVDSVGINIQPTFDNEYDAPRYPAVKQLLEDLEIKLVRGQAPAGQADARAFYRELWTDLAIKTHWTTGIFIADDADRAQLRAMIEELDATAKAGIHSLGGYNEPNGARTEGHVVGTEPGETPWDVLTLTHQQWLWNTAHTVPGLEHVMVCGPSLHDHPPGNGMGSSERLQDDYRRLAPCAPYMDAINMHRYPGGNVPPFGIEERTLWARDGIGLELPIVVTETGYNNGMHTAFVNRTPPTVIGKYAPRMLIEHIRRGNVVMWFELLNNAPPNSSNNQNFYGIVSVGSTTDTSTWVPMPAYDAIRRMLTRFHDPGVDYDPEPLAIEIDGPTSLEPPLLFGKRDGSYQLVLWRNLSVWKKSTQTESDRDGINVTINLEAPRTITVHCPSRQDAPLQTVTDDTVTTSLDEELQVIDIAP